MGKKRLEGWQDGKNEGRVGRRDSQKCIRSFIHPFIHSLTQVSLGRIFSASKKKSRDEENKRLTQPPSELGRSSIHPSKPSFTHLSIHSSTHLFIHPFINLSIHPYIHSSIHSYTHTFIIPSIHFPIHPLIHPPIAIHFFKPF